MQEGVDISYISIGARGYKQEESLPPALRLPPGKRGASRTQGSSEKVVVHLVPSVVGEDLLRRKVGMNAL
jgi:hypothetical protein